MNVMHVMCSWLNTHSRYATYAVHGDNVIATHTFDSTRALSRAEALAEWVSYIKTTSPRHWTNYQAMFAPTVCTPYRNRATRRALGAAVARAINGDDNAIGDIIYIGNGSAFSWRTRRSIARLGIDGVRICAHCADTLIDDENDDGISTDDGPICAYCRDEYVWCEDTEEYSHQDNVAAAYTGVYCGSPSSVAYFQHTNDLIPIEWDGAAGYITEYAADRLGWYMCDDGVLRSEPNNADDTDKCYGVYEYHDHPYRENPSYFREPTGSCAIDPAIGIELEHYCSDSYSALQSIGLDWILERDGSLDSRYGVEMVSPPLLLSQWHETIPELCDALKQYGGKAYNAPNGMYGVHITVHRRHLKPLQEVRMTMFLVSADNADFVRAIGQRQSIYSAYNYNIGCFAKPKVKHLNGGINSSGKIETPKMCPLHLEDRLAECRIFQSTLAPDALMKHIEFYHALIAWTRPAAMTGTSWHYVDFYHWLSLSQNKKAYPALNAWLKKPEFKVKNGSTIQNTWSN